MDLHLNIIIEYYSQLDKNFIIKLNQNDKLRKLINLSVINNIFIFIKKNNKWVFKNKKTILHECEKKKKLEIKNILNTLNNLIKINDSIKLLDIKNIFNNLESKIESINILIDYLSTDIDEIILTNVNTKKSLSNIVFLSNPYKTINLSKINIMTPINNSNTESNEIDTNIDNFIAYYSNC
jgi:hypothetical protein